MLKRILGKRNTIAHVLLRTIFSGEISDIEEKQGREIMVKDGKGDGEWFSKEGNGDYEELMGRRLRKERK